jgi:PepSY-associated TM region
MLHEGRDARKLTLNSPPALVDLRRGLAGGLAEALLYTREPATMNLRKALDWRKALIYTHRWLGIALTAVFVIWFVSGVIFVYVGMPTLPAEERLLRMEPLDVSTIAVSPAEAASRVDLKSPSRVRIAMYGRRPVYRFFSSGTWQALYADSGAALTPLTADAAVEVMRRVVPEHATTLRYDTRLTDADQWTLQGVIRNTMPLHRIALGDAAGTEYYVSERTGEPVLQTTARGRFWGYMSAVLHWLYFTPLRRHGAFWATFVIWISLVGTVMCAMGITIGIWRYSLARRFRLRGMPASRSPYAGWIRWHHYTGLFFGFFACTWALSGALSLDPFTFLETSPPSKAMREAATGGPLDLTPLTVEHIRSVMDTVRRSFHPKELDFFQFLGEPYFIAYVPPSSSEHPPWRNSDISAASALHIDRQHVMVSVRYPERGPLLSFEPDRMWDVANAAMPTVAVADATWLTEYDAYYYSHSGTKPLPVLRIRYADPRATWLYLDPQRGIIALRLERASRWNRWLYHGFHSLDFPFLYYKRPLWDIVVILLSIGGVAISVTSALPAWRRLVRQSRHLRSRPGAAADAVHRSAGVP